MGRVYQFSQELKPRIELSVTLMDALRNYSGSHPYDCTLYPLGAGNTNVHFRLGQLESGLWLATRENLTFEDSPLQRIVTENYARQLEFNNERGRTTSRICLGVKVPSPDLEVVEDRYFIIVEDFTQGGNADFRPGHGGQDCGTVNGEIVYYDFPDQVHQVDFKFMDDSSVIQVK